MKTCYLAGPIVGCTTEEANDWRHQAIARLAPHNIRGISPLRCEPVPTGDARYGLTYEDPMFGTARAISSKNLYDVRTCDIGIYYAPAVLSKRRPPFGTICELSWARALERPAVFVSDDLDMLAHPVINACAGWMVKTLNEGIEIVIGVIEDYARGRA